MSAEPELEYLTTRQVAARLGIKPKTVRQKLWRGVMPEPDLFVLGHNLWLADTIERWVNRPRKRRKKARMRNERVRIAERTTLPKNARISTEGIAPVAIPAVSTVSQEIAASIAAALRDEGQHCTTRDVVELAGAGPDGLDYERRKLQQRVQRKVRGLKSRA